MISWTRVILVALVATILVAAGSFAFVALSSAFVERVDIYPRPKLTMWQIQSVDTVKFSRDLAREKLEDPSFDAVIEQQVSRIAAAGATHVAIGTPYDEEFVPFLERWVAAARRAGLHVWFRGNWSGWEGWFDYPQISPEQHLAKTTRFIADHPDLFADGDIFTPCPECENGGPGDPRQTRLITSYRQFLINENAAAADAFRAIGKDVRVGLTPMNGDVARLIMDASTTAALGGVVTVDHYVASPEELAKDVAAYGAASGGEVMLGEFGAPIPDIHGDFTPQEQAQWLHDALAALAETPGVLGVNYWTGFGGSTAIWDDDGTAKPAAGVLAHFFRPRPLYGSVRDELDRPIADATVRIGVRDTKTDQFGYFELPTPEGEDFSLDVEATGYVSQTLHPQGGEAQLAVVLVREHEGFWFRLLKGLRGLSK
jgi:hypothetical protein